MPRDDGRPNDLRAAVQRDMMEDDDATSAETRGLLDAHFPDLAPWRGNAYGGFADNNSHQARCRFLRHDEDNAVLAWGAVAGVARHDVKCGANDTERRASKMGRGIVRAVELVRGSYTRSGGG